MKKLLCTVLLLATSAAAVADVIKTVQAGSTDQTVTVRIIDSADGTPETGVAYNTSGIDLKYWRHGANTVTDITEATQTVSGAHSDGGFVHLGNGVYRLDLPDAAVASSATAVDVFGTVTGMIVIGGTVQLSPPVDVVSAAGTAWGSGAITAASIATDAIGAAELAADAIGASEIAADAIGAAEIANAAIDAATFAASAIDATAIATDAIGAAEIATDAIGAAELAASAIGASEIADGGITSTEFGTGAITATVIAADAITSSEIADGAIDAGALASDTITAAKIAADAIGSSEIAANAIAEDAFDTTAGSFKPLGIIDQGTAQAATATTVQLRSAAAFGDDTILGATIVACGSTQGYCQAGVITDYVGSTDTATVATWGVTPSGTITYYVFGTAPASGSGGSLTAADVWAYATRTLTALDEDSTTIDLNASAVGSVAGSVASVATGGITAASFGAGAIDAAAIAADAIGASELATDAIGATEIAANAITDAEVAADVTIASVTGAVGSVTGAVGSVTGNVGGNVTGSVGSVATGGITAASIAADAIGASELAADAGTELATAAWANATRTLSAGTNIVLAKGTGITGFNDPTVAAIADAVWDEAQSGHTTAGSFGLYLDSAISGVSTGGVSAGAIADAVWDEAISGHLTGGTTGAVLNGAGDPWATALPGAYSAGSAGYIIGTNLNATVSSRASQTSVDTVDDYVDTEVAAILDDTGTSGVVVSASSVRTAVGLAAANLDTQIGDLPTNAELATSQASADDATLAAIAALNNLSAANVRDVVIEDQGSGVTLGCAISVVLAYAAGDLATTASTSTYEDPSGTETRITGTVASAGNRTASVTCPTY